MPLGEFLRSAADDVIDICDPSGALLAKVLLKPEPEGENYASLLADAEANIAELRRRRVSDRSKDVTTAQLLARLKSLASE
jgi:hypothetical protein